MARAQGEGVLRGVDKRVLAVAYVRQDYTWKIERVAWERL
jgi:hypothetical protein